MRDAELAQRVRDAEMAFNAAVDAAASEGISVSFGVSVWTTKPSKTHICNLRIYRQSRWIDDYAGESL